MAARGRVRRRIVLAVALSGTIVVAILAIVVIASQTPWVRHWIESAIESQASDRLRGDLTVGRVEGNLITGVRLEDVSLVQDGAEVIHARSLEIAYQPQRLLAGSIALERIVINEPIVHLRRTQQGLNLAHLLEPGAAENRASAPIALALDDVEVRDGTVTIGDRVDTYPAIELPDRVTHVDARLAVSRHGESGLSVQVTDASFDTASPPLHVAELKGRITFTDTRLRLNDVMLKTRDSQLQVDGTVTIGPTPRVDLNIKSPRLSLGEFAALAPALGSHTLSPAFMISLSGTAGALHVDGRVNTREGDIHVDVTADVSGSRRTVAGTISSTDLNLAAIDADLEPTDITASAGVDLAFTPDAGIVGTYDLQAPELTYGQYSAADVSATGRLDGRTILVDARAAAYDGTARTTGTITLPDNGSAFTYDLHGTLHSVNLEKAARDLKLQQANLALAAQGANSSATLDYRITSGPSGGIDTRLRIKDLSFAGATFSEGTVIEIGRRRGRLTYSIDGRVYNLDLTDVGRRIGIGALADPRYSSAIDAAVDFDGAGTSLEDLTLKGTAILTNSHLFGGAIPRLLVQSALVRGVGTIRLAGAFSDVDVARLAARPDFRGSLSGTIDATASLPHSTLADASFERLDVSGRVVLSNSTVEGIRVEHALVEGRYDDRLAILKAVEVTGPDLAAKLSGQLALDRQQSSDLSYEVSAPAVSRIDLIGIPLRGGVTAQGHLTGNLEAFHLTGALSGEDVAYSSTSALAMHSKYSITIPDLTWRLACGSAETQLDSARVGGRTLTRVHARTVYDDGRVDFDARVNEAGRSLETGGKLVWHPDHQEVHLNDLRLQSGRIEWQLAPDTSATIRYAADRLIVDGLVLRGREGGRIAADGAIGPGAANPLRLRISALDLEDVNRLVPGAPAIAGQVDLTAEVTGSLSAPTVEGQLAWTAGTFESFTFDRFAGRFDYGEGSLGLAVRLTASGGSWLTAEGDVPLRADAGRSSLNLRLRSSRIGLAMIQGFTDEIAGVSGTLGLDVLATGSYRDPHLQGYADIANGAFTAVAAGVRYRGVNTRVAFEQDLVRIPEFRIVDEDGAAMTIGGQLALHERHVSGLQIHVQGRSFKVMDNPLGQLEVGADLQISGELTRPRLEGRISLASGTLRVDRILDLTDTPYATRPVVADDRDRALRVSDARSGEHGAVTSARASEAGAVDTSLHIAQSRDDGIIAISADLRLDIPNNLVLKGTDIQLPGASIPTGLGNVNLTIGGSLDIEKPADGDVRLRGQVRPIRGTYEFEGREFEIQREGQIVFAGTSEVNPTLDLLATRLISGVETRIHIAGTLDDPRLELSSEPPLDEGDILALIVFNRPLNELGDDEEISLAQRAAAIAAGFVGSELAETIGDALALDIFDIDVGGAAPSVVVGEQFAHGVFLKFRQQLSASATSSLLLEYELTDWLRLRSEINQSQTATRGLFDRSERGAIKLRFTFRY